MGLELREMVDVVKLCFNLEPVAPPSTLVEVKLIEVTTASMVVNPPEK